MSVYRWRWLKGLFIWDREVIGNIKSESYLSHSLPLIQAFKQEHEIFHVGIGNGLLMQDRASSHTAHATKSALEERAIRLLWCPASSPDSNPIENAWRLLKSRVQERFPKTKEELIRCIKEELIICIREEWERIEPQKIQKYCLNIRERYQSVLQARVGHTILRHLPNPIWYIKYTLFVTNSMRFDGPCVKVGPSPFMVTPCIVSPAFTCWKKPKGARCGALLRGVVFRKE